MSYGVIIKY